MKKLLLNLLLAGAAVCLVVAAVRAAGDAPAASPAPATSDSSDQSDKSDSSDNQPIRMPVVTPKMRRWSRINWTLFFVRTAYGLFLLWAILASGLSARLRTRRPASRQAVRATAS